MNQIEDNTFRVRDQRWCQARLVMLCNESVWNHPNCTTGGWWLVAGMQRGHPVSLSLAGSITSVPCSYHPVLSNNFIIYQVVKHIFDPSFSWIQQNTFGFLFVSFCSRKQKQKKEGEFAGYREGIIKSRCLWLRRQQVEVSKSFC